VVWGSAIGTQKTWSLGRRSSVLRRPPSMQGIAACDPNATFYSPGRSCRRQVEGGTPAIFLNARLKDASDL
jgi:hypothetical protein